MSDFGLSVTWNKTILPEFQKSYCPLANDDLTTKVQDILTLKMSDRTKTSKKVHLCIHFSPSYGSAKSSPINHNGNVRRQGGRGACLERLSLFIFVSNPGREFLFFWFS